MWLTGSCRQTQTHCPLTDTGAVEKMKDIVQIQSIFIHNIQFIESIMIHYDLMPQEHYALMKCLLV